jgi:CBS domain-containing protein
VDTVKELLRIKGPHVLTVGTDATVLQAVNLMNDHHVGSLVVLDQGRIVGMFTERDILRRVVGEHRAPDHTTVGEVMTTEVFACNPSTPIEEARAAMRDHRIRHLPVLDEAGALLGVISIGDLNAYQVTDQERTIFLLHEYLYGRA